MRHERPFAPKPFARLAVAAAVVLVVMGGASETLAQSRAADHLRAQLRQLGRTPQQISELYGFSGQDRTTASFRNGGSLISSVGMWSVNIQGRDGPMLYAYRVYNTTPEPICARVSVRGRTAALPGRYGDSSNINILIPAGGSESVVNYGEDVGVSHSLAFSVGYYFWRADMNAGNGRLCSSVAPTDLQEWIRAARDNPGRVRITPDLLQRLGGYAD